MGIDQPQRLLGFRPGTGVNVAARRTLRPPVREGYKVLAQLSPMIWKLREGHDWSGVA